MLIYDFLLVFSLVCKVRASIYIQAPNNVPKLYLETLIRKFAKPLKDIQALTGERVQLEFSIRSPHDNPNDEYYDSSDYVSVLRRSAGSRPKTVKRNPLRSRILTVPSIGSPHRKISIPKTPLLASSHGSNKLRSKHSMKSSYPKPIRYTNKYVKKEIMPNSLKKPVGKQNSPSHQQQTPERQDRHLPKAHLKPLSNHPPSYPSPQQYQQHSQFLSPLIRSQNSPNLPPPHSIPQTHNKKQHYLRVSDQHLQSKHHLLPHPSLPKPEPPNIHSPPLEGPESLRFLQYHSSPRPPPYPLPSAQPPSLPPSYNIPVTTFSSPAAPQNNVKKAIDLEDINKAFDELQKRLIARQLNDTASRMINKEDLNKTLESFEKKILDTIVNGPKSQKASKDVKEDAKKRYLRTNNVRKEPPDPKKQQDNCDDEKLLMKDAYKPLLFEDLWKYFGKRKCEEDRASSKRTSTKSTTRKPHPRHNSTTTKGKYIARRFESYEDDYYEYDDNNNILIHTGDYSEPIRIPLANVFSRLIF